MTNISEMTSQDLRKVIFTGNIDDGKSSIIGRLFYDSRNLYEDQLQDLKLASDAYGKGHLDLSLFTDGLRSEREQGITIDVAHLYFHTTKRRFIILDTPGHEQYIANMVSAASQADIAVILVDITKNLCESTKKHLFVCHQMGIKNIIICFNKIDLVKYSEDYFVNRKLEIQNYISMFSFKTVDFIPLSALHGDMVVERGSNLSWFPGNTLLESLEQIDFNVNSEPELPFRLCVQGINRPHAIEMQDFRGFNGQILSGEITVGSEIMVHPQKKRAKIKEIWMGTKRLESACVPMSITVLLDQEFDVGRGNMMTSEDSLLKLSANFNSRIFVFSNEYNVFKRDFIFKIMTNTSVGKITKIYNEVNIKNLHEQNAAHELEVSRFYDVEITLRDPIPYYSFKDFYKGGRFVLIDSQTFKTIAVGMITERN